MATGRSRAPDEERAWILKAELLSGLNAAKDKADARANYRDCMAAMRQQGWSDADVKEYSESIGVLMGEDDTAALALFPAGTYANAEDARAEARKFWKNHV